MRRQNASSGAYESPASPFSISKTVEVSSSLSRRASTQPAFPPLEFRTCQSISSQYEVQARLRTSNNDIVVLSLEQVDLLDPACGKWPHDGDDDDGWLRAIERGSTSYIDDRPSPGVLGDLRRIRFQKYATPERLSQR